MQIGEQYPAFHKKTLVVVADHKHAKLFLGEDREFTFLEEVKTTHLHPEAGDRTSMLSSTGGHGAVINEKETIIDEDHLFHALAKDLHIRLEKHEYEDLIIAAGQEVHQLQKLLHHDVNARVLHLIPKLLTEFNGERLLEHLELGQAITEDRS
ncbi:MAG: host attachment protein [Candidatus Uhrbacteria bacterium]|nr:host attachment protein [Candidatus Uhrbacteria bacterium]